MDNYALIKDGLIQNVVIWDGEGDLFDEFITYKLSSDDSIGPGFTATKGENESWTFTAPAVVVTPEEVAQRNLATAQAEYDRASVQITAINQRIEDEDYSGDNTEEAVAASKVTWTTYRKSLRAYLTAADGSVALPKAPDV